jgi:hypothetical protein
MLLGWGGRGGKIVIPMPEALSFAESRRQQNLKTKSHVQLYS